MFSTEEEQHTKTEIPWFKSQIVEAAAKPPPFRVLWSRGRAMLDWPGYKLIGEDIPRRKKLRGEAVK